jgi:hypothetical protein
MPLLVVEESSRLRVESTVDESIAVRPGDAVSVDLAGARVGARVTQVVPALDPAAHTALVKIDLPAGSARPGTFARVLLTTGHRPALTIPSSAVQRRGQLASVFVVGGDGTARLRLVTLGESGGARVEVLSGLEAGERIVTRAVEGLRDGTAVRS